MDNEKIIVDALRKRTSPKASQSRKASSKATKKARSSKPKRIKKEKLSTIRNRLMKLWISRCVEIYDHKCAVCGDEVKPNAHHIVNRDISPALRFNPNNSISLCASHHKFGLKSAHKNGVWFAHWLEQHAPLQHQYIIDHTDDLININDRETLYKLEAILRAPVTKSEKLFHGVLGNDTEGVGGSN